MRKLLAIGAVALTLALSLATGGAWFSSHYVQTSGQTPLLVDSSSPDGLQCGGSVSTFC